MLFGEAYRVYGGTAWLRYDDQLQQRRAVRPALRWDHKDISLWMKLMTTVRAPNQFFQGGGGGPSSQGHSVGNRKGVCWLYNTGTCRLESHVRINTSVQGGGISPRVQRFQAGKMHVQERLQTKGRTPVKVERMRPFLGRYPDRAAAQLLEVGFFGWL